MADDRSNEPTKRSTRVPWCYDRPMVWPRPTAGERAQSTVEYAILLLGAAAVAMLVVTWVSDSDVIGRLFETVFDKILSRT